MRRIWQIYIAVWIVYVVLAGIAVQLDEMGNGELQLYRFGINLLSAIPAACVLALVWPLSAYLEKKQLGTGPFIAAHFAAAIVFATLWHLLDHELLRRMLGHPRKSYFWYIWPFFYSMMMYGVMAGVAHSIRFAQAERQQALAASQAQTLLMSAELAALRNKLNPHFLFNTLHSIIALIRKDPPSAEAALFRFSDMLRYLLETEKSGSDRVLLEDELGFVRDYLNLEALRLGSRLQVEWEIDPHTLHLSLPALSVQPLVENSIKHAFNPRSQAGHLKISSRLDQQAGYLELKISDDGPGCDPAQLEQASGMGLKTVRRRLQLAYQGQAKVGVQSAPGQGFAICLQLPLHEAAAA